MLLHTSGIKRKIVDSWMRVAYINDRKDSPVAKNRNVVSNL